MRSSKKLDKSWLLQQLRLFKKRRQSRSKLQWYNKLKNRNKYLNQRQLKLSKSRNSQLCRSKKLFNLSLKSILKLNQLLRLSYLTGVLEHSVNPQRSRKLNKKKKLKLSKLPPQQWIKIIQAQRLFSINLILRLQWASLAKNSSQMPQTKTAQECSKTSQMHPLNLLILRRLKRSKVKLWKSMEK